METRRLLMATPGKRWIEVHAFEREHVVKRDEYGNEYVCPLLDDDSGIYALSIFIKEAIEKGRNCPVLLTGDPGLGKSTVINKVAVKIDPKFDVDKIAFPLEEFQKIFDENPYGDAKAGIFPQASADESAHAMYGPEYLELEQRVLTKNLTVSRIKKEIVYFATPRWKLLNPHVRNYIYIWVHVSEPDFYHPGYAVVKMPPPQLQNEYASQKYWAAQFAFVFRRMTGPLWDRYEAKKVAFVNSTLSEDTDKRSTMLKKIARKLRESGMSEKEIGGIIGRDQSTVSDYLHRGAEEGRQIGPADS